MADATVAPNRAESHLITGRLARDWRESARSLAYSPAIMATGEHPVSPADRTRYGEVLAQIVTRLQGARTYLGEDPTRANVEYAALQMRMTLELIVVGSLVTNRTAIDATASALAKMRVNQARELAKTVNPEYWPKPVHIEGNVMDGKTVEGALTEQKWRGEWGFVSDLLHARNPFRAPLDERKAHERLVRLMSEVMTLLNHHIVTLADTNFLLLGQMDESGSHVTPFQRAE